MKKVLLLMVAFLTLFVGCSNVEPETEPQNSVQYSKRENQLAFLKQNSTYLLTEGQMEDSLKSFVARSGGAARSLATADSYVLTKKSVETVTVKNAKADTSREAESAEAEETQEEFPIYTYEIYNSETGKSAVAVTSTDLRLGAVLAVTEEGDLNDEEVKPFADIFYSKLNDYIYETAYLWNNVEVEDDVERDAVAIDIYVTQLGTCFTYSNFNEQFACTNAVLRTKWGQHNPYNNLVVAALGNSGYVTGCTVTALAQVMAGLEYNESSILLPNGYDWSAMKATPDAHDVSPEAQNQISHLMWYLGQNLRANYKLDTNGNGATSVFDSDVETYLNAFGYTYYGEYFSLPTVLYSLNIGLPLLCSGTDDHGTGHSWVIDGYKIYTCTMKNKATEETAEITDYFLHCNLGWDGIADGYYRSSIFNTTNVPLLDASSSNAMAEQDFRKFYKYYLHTISHIWHAK